MSKLVPVGSFCPNEDCPDYGETGRGNIIRYGKTGEGRQRFQCKTCKRTFNERQGTLFYNRKTDEKEILECLALVTEGVRIRSIRRAKGIKEDTILYSYEKRPYMPSRSKRSCWMSTRSVKSKSMDCGPMWGVKRLKKTDKRR